MGQDLRSPQRHVLRQLEGNPTDIDRQARDLVDAAEVMRSVATRLQRLADGTDTVSQAESVDQVRGSAGDVVPGLKKAATRYQMTGDALLAYARELETAQLAIRPKIEDIETKHAAVQTARHVVVRGLDGGPNNLDPPAFDRDGDRARRSDAAQDLATAESELATAWSGFDQVFGVWEEAYDRAVGGIDDAFDAADNNDAWGEDYLALLGYVGMALCVVALFCTGPVALVIAAIGALVALVVVAINVAKFAKGRGNWLDLGVAIVSVIPFVRPLATAGRTIRGASAARTTLQAGKDAVRSSVRSTMKTHGQSLPGRALNRLNDVRASVRTGFLNTQFKAYDFLSRPGQNWLRGGHDSLTSFGNFLRGKGADKVGGEILEWAATNAPQKGASVWSILENGTSNAADLYFLAEEHVPVFHDHVVNRFDQ
ncbi:MAG: hypothetical protein FWH11_02310 [Micrococcales bacterium]|nr:hypothetical protein [Micrococcales bacterium]